MHTHILLRTTTRLDTYVSTKNAHIEYTSPACTIVSRFLYPAPAHSATTHVLPPLSPLLPLIHIVPTYSHEHILKLTQTLTLTTILHQSHLLFFSPQFHSLNPSFLTSLSISFLLPLLHKHPPHTSHTPASQHFSSPFLRHTIAYIPTVISS